MSSAMPRTRYSQTLIFLHWATVILVISAYALMEFKGIFPKDSLGRDWMKSLHYSTGASILALTLIRLVMHFGGTPAALQPEPARWQALAAKAMHWALYGMLILMPITGWLGLNAFGRDVMAWGLPLPTMLDTDKSVGGLLMDMHETIALIGYGLVGLHAAAALYHHHILGDATLRRMLPARAPA